MLELRLRHDFGGFQLDVDFQAPKGITALFGRSGSGKTSIIHAVAGILRPQDGYIALDGRVLLDRAARVDCPTHRRRLGYIFQDARLFPHLTVMGNLRYGARFAPRPPARAAMDRVIDLLGLEGLAARRIGDLSGGERQRVAIGRALLSDPAAILADEPLAALDAARKAEILPYFERLRDEVAVPILYVSHAPSEVARLANHVIALEAGRVIAQGDAQTVLADPAVLPMGARAAGAVLSARVLRHHADGLTELEAGGLPLFLPRIDRPLGAVLRVRIAAHEVILSKSRPEGLSALNILRGVLVDIRSGEGPGAIAAIDTAAGRILARLTRRSVAAMGLGIGQEVHAIVKSVALAPDDIGA